MAETSDIPDPRDELERKTGETLEEWLLAVQNGTCSATDAKNALRATWSVVAGLVSRKQMDLLSDAISALERHPESYFPTRVFARQRVTATIQLRGEEIVAAIDGKVSRFDTGKMTYQGMNDLCERMVSRFEKTGFKEIK